MGKTFIEESKDPSYGPAEGASISLEGLQVGCLMRIATAMESIAKNYTQLQNERDRYERWYYEERAKVKIRDNRIRSLKGVITRKKNREI